MEWLIQAMKLCWKDKQGVISAKDLQNDARVQEKVVAGIQKRGGKKGDDPFSSAPASRSIGDSWMKNWWIECSSRKGELFPIIDL